MSTLLIGSDARLSRRLINSIDFKYKTSRRYSPNSNLYLDFCDIEKFKIPNDVSKCLIVGGPVSYEDAKKSHELVKLIHKVKIPFLTIHLVSKFYRFLRVTSMAFDCSE